MKQSKGVPLGSTLGPPVFTLHLKGHLTNSGRIRLYADDAFLYPDDQTTTVAIGNNNNASAFKRYPAELCNLKQRKY